MTPAKQAAIEKVDIILKDAGLYKYSEVVRLMEEWEATLRRSKDVDDLNTASLHDFLRDLRCEAEISTESNVKNVIVHFQPHRGSTHRVTFNSAGEKVEMVESKVGFTGSSWRTLWRAGGVKNMSNGVACAIRGAQQKLAKAKAGGVEPQVSSITGRVTYL